ncbi:hypothetical protein MKW92_028557, partial [Papaver armeniacum]
RFVDLGEFHSINVVAVRGLLRRCEGLYNKEEELKYTGGVEVFFNAKLKGILSRETVINSTLQFLYSNNSVRNIYYFLQSSDLLIMKTIKQSVEMRNNVFHSATIYANAIMHTGTTVDTFFEGKLVELLVVVVHIQRGGALYALRLIYANRGEGIRQFLHDSLRSTNVIQYGARLGLGLAALGTADEEIYDDIKNVIYTDSDVAGEVTGIGMGLLMVGTNSEKASIALTVYGREEEADTLIEQMTRDQDPVLRYGGMYVLAMAYMGTTNNKAIRHLFHFAVSDISDDVRRTAVLALGFVFSSEPEQTPRIVSLLSESYDPHVRYGAAMAVGISCAGTSLSEAISLLEPLTSDVVDFVRQGALIAMTVVMIQTSKTCDSRVGSFRRQLEKIILDKHEDTMSKMGAILTSGILDARGRNVTIRLLSKNRHDKVIAVVGLAVFSQFWHDIYEYVLMDCECV